MNNTPLDINALAHLLGMKELELIQLRQQVALMNEHIEALTKEKNEQLPITS
jgi:hypothetical protein